MLDPWIIEEIKRREQHKQEQPVIELPIRGPEGRDRSKNDGHEMPSEEDPPRGVTIIDYGVACW